MKKTTLTLLLILFTIASILLIWQWNNYSNSKGLLEETEQAQQHITVEAIGRDLSITQNVTGLADQKEYRVIKSDSLFRWECKDRNGRYCSSNDDSPQTFLASNGELNFQYVIPIQNQSAFLLTEWISSINNVEMVCTTIDIVERERRDSAWVAGIPQIGFKKLSFIDFYTFKGEEPFPALYWQQKPIFKNDENQYVTFYSKQSGAYEEVLQNLKPLKLNEYTSIILTEDHKPSSGNGIQIVSSLENFKELEEKLVYSFFENKFKSLLSEEKWILELLTAETLKEPVSGQRSTAVLQELSSKLSETERQSWLKTIQQEVDYLNFQKLDQAFESVNGLKTTFFSLNRSEKVQWTPLYFVDLRNITIHDKVIENIHVVSRGKEILFPFVPTMKELGFLVKSNEDDKIELSNGKNSYKFDLDQPFFYSNEEIFGLLDQPFVVENGVIYIKREPLKLIFNVIVEEDQNLIKLNIK
jgi:hypothetical protein